VELGPLGDGDSRPPRLLDHTDQTAASSGRRSGPIYRNDGRLNGPSVNSLLMAALFVEITCIPDTNTIILQIPVRINI
jgi:hypothetical protein